jgi:5S rRNA maturation endonuclease (ribonuclease M5)
MYGKNSLKQKRIELLKDLFEDLKKNQHSILVEGLNDRLALKMGGIKEERIEMLHGRSLLQVEDSLEKEDEIILLLDYDAEGNKLNKHFKRVLQRKGIKANIRFRRELRKIFDGHLDCIEHLKGYFSS